MKISDNKLAEDRSNTDLSDGNSIQGTRPHLPFTSLLSKRFSIRRTWGGKPGRPRI